MSNGDVCPICRGVHRGLCHRCPHAAEVAAGDFADHAFESTPCYGCRDEQFDGRGGEVSFDSVQDSAFATEIVESVSSVRILQALYDLPNPIMREIVIARACGAELPALALTHQISTQAAHAALCRAIKHDPEIWGALFRNVLAKRTRRKKHERKQ